MKWHTLEPLPTPNRCHSPPCQGLKVNLKSTPRSHCFKSVCFCVLKLMIILILLLKDWVWRGLAAFHWCPPRPSCRDSPTPATLSRVGPQVATSSSGSKMSSRKSPKIPESKFGSSYALATSMVVAWPACFHSPNPRSTISHLGVYFCIDEKTTHPLAVDLFAASVYLFALLSSLVGNHFSIFVRPVGNSSKCQIYICKSAMRLCWQKSNSWSFLVEKLRMINAGDFSTVGCDISLHFD